MPKKRFSESFGELKNIKSRNDMIICFCGCMSQEPHVIEKIKNSYQLVDIIFGTHNIYKFPDMDYINKKNKKNIQRGIYIFGGKTKEINGLTNNYW